MDIQVFHADGGDAAEWDSFVDRQPGSSNYHRYAWREVIERSFGHTTHYLAARDRQGTIRGVLPLAHMSSLLFGTFLVSLPFFNYGGILTDGQETAELLLREADEFRERLAVPVTELRHVGEGLKGLATRQHKVTMILELKGSAEEQWKALDPKVRNQIRKAEKCGLTAVIGGSELLEGFYEVFCRNMRDLGTPVYGRSFFENILAWFPGSTRILSVKSGETTVAAGLLTWFRDTLEVPWASSIAEYRDKCPNNLLYWEAIRFAIDIGATRFDFGRSTPGEGTYRFKKQWGAHPVPLYWQYQHDSSAALPELNPSNPRYRLAVKAWQRLPLTIANLLGPRIVRSIP